MILVFIYINFTIFLKRPRTKIGYTCIFNAVFFYITLKLNGEDLYVCYGLYVFTSISSSYFITDYLSVLVPYIFTSFSNPEAQCPVKAFVLVPYIFTSFSNTSGYCNCRICVSVPHVFTSFSNMLLCAIPEPVVSVPYVFTSFSNRNIRSFRDCRFQYHTFLHHSQTKSAYSSVRSLFQYHTFLHHSQTMVINTCNYFGFSTIHFYIILKRARAMDGTGQCFSTIHFYIILKPTRYRRYGRKSFSTIHFYIILKLIYKHYLSDIRFQYHTFLHHSQTHLLI